MTPVEGWVTVGPGALVRAEEVVMVLDWAAGKDSTANRQMVSYCRAHGFLVETGGTPQSLVVTREKIYLTQVTAATLRKRFQWNVVSPPSEGVLR